MEAHDERIRDYVKDYVHPNALTGALKFIGLRNYEFAPKNERSFIALELENGEGFLSISTWLSLDKSDKDKVKDGRLEFSGSVMPGAKWNVCIEVCEHVTV